MDMNAVMNKLADEASPYLRQHAHNPVDWFPWSDQALQKAKSEEKPLIISIGYSACHWCHVMAEESFSDSEVAQLMNKYFVSLKVDREERPDLDLIYQTACHLLTRSGGWPLTVFATPDGKPFFVGTYFPPENFKQILTNLGQAFQDHPEKLEELGDQVTEAVKESFQVSEPAGDEGLIQRIESIVKASRTNLSRYYDWENGGFGGAPKFPSVPILEFFWAGSLGDQEKVLVTLKKMIAGGIYDQVAGGFHRYSTDENWLIPHFEKMLYDNALLLQLMAKAFLKTGSEMIGEALEQTADFVLSELTGPSGEFYSSLDADSEGREGTYYLWDPEEIRAANPKESPEFLEYFGVTQEGNFEEGKSVLARKRLEPIPTKFKPVLDRLKDIRNGRERPFRDEKVLTAWNGLMISALTYTYLALKEEKYLGAAEKGVLFIKENLENEDGELLRSHLGKSSGIPGFLEDYAFLISGLLDLFEVTKERKYLDEAIRLQRVSIRKFSDFSAGGFFMVQPSKDLIIRPKESTDGAIPAATGVTLLNLQRLLQYNGDLAKEFGPILKESIKHYLNAAAEDPWGHATILLATENYSVISSSSSSG